MNLLFGAIADDFTGATDLADTLVRQGLRVVQAIGVPQQDDDFEDAEAVVIALKSRSAPVDAAVRDSLAALRWLEARGTRQYFFKYCSTFDSTPAGNIGPVIDALMQALDCDFTLLCPAFPANGRTVYQGHLFVGSQLLSDSPMKNHPLTPMTEANLVQLMDAQSAGRSGLIALADVVAGRAAIEHRIADLRARGCSYGVIDAIDDSHLADIGKAAADHRLVTGGSAIALGLARNFRVPGASPASSALPQASGRELVLSGSCSAATRAQINALVDRWPMRKIDIDALAAGEDVVAQLAGWAAAQPAASPLLIYSSADPAEVSEIQHRHGIEASGEMIEQLLGELAARLVSRGFRRLVVAGGETSGAVVSSLGVKALRIGAQIAPGVPWTETIGTPRIALALKSGNFGGEDFFTRAFGMLS